MSKVKTFEAKLRAILRGFTKAELATVPISLFEVYYEKAQPQQGTGIKNICDEAANLAISMTHRYEFGNHEFMREYTLLLRALPDAINAVDQHYGSPGETKEYLIKRMEFYRTPNSN